MKRDPAGIIGRKKETAISGVKSFEGKEFDGFSLSGEEISGKEFSGCRFKSCDFSGCRFKGLVLSDCAFVSCSLANSRVIGCSFRGAVLEDCKLVNVSFDSVNPFLLDWDFRKCKVEFCSFSGLKMKHSRFTDSLVRKNEFLDVDLSNADFSGSDLSGSRFQNAILENAVFLGARNYYLDPRQNRMKNARFSYPEVLSLLSPFEVKVEG